MNISIAVPIMGNFGRKGFYQSQEIGLGRALAQSGHNVQVYKCVRPDQFSEVEKEDIEDKLAVTYIPTKHIGKHGLLDVNLIDPETQVLFVFSDTQLIIRKIYKYCKNHNILFIPYVGIAHSWKSFPQSAVFDTLYKILTLPVYKKCTVVAKTIAAKKELKAQGVKDIVVAPVGMDFSALKQDYEDADRNKLRKKWRFSENDIIVSFVARLEPEKRPEALIDIFSKLNNESMKLLIVGKGSQHERIQEMVKSHKLDERVTIIEQVPYPEMWEIHYIADYFLNLRPDEIFGMAIMEAVFYKSTVLARRAPGPETILDGMPGHYICDTDEEIVEILNREVEADPDDLQTAKNMLKEKFTWQACAREIEKVAMSEMKK